MAEPASRPIIAQIVLLVSGAVLLATAVFFGVTFQGPPPRSAPVPLADIAAALDGSSQLSPSTRRSTSPDKPAPQGLTEQPAASDRLSAMTGRPAFVYTEKPLAGRGGAPLGSTSIEIRGGVTAGVRDGAAWRVVAIPPEPWLSRWHLVTLAAMLATFLALVLGAWAVARKIAGPLSHLAEAADATRALPSDPAIPIDGPPEVRRVAEALTRMRDRLAANVANRTDMLIAIAHDMGTPLSRLAFRLDTLPEEARNAAQVEIAEMRAMIGSVLDYARNTPPDIGPVDIAILLRQLIEGTTATLDAPATAVVQGDGLALKRLFGNLVENALRYAGDCAVSVIAEGNALIVRVADTGPGLPDDPAVLFEPFVRGEYSRSRATGGVGLGLAIAHRVAEAHGGTISAANRSGGGAVFEVTLPIR